MQCIRFLDRIAACLLVAGLSLVGQASAADAAKPSPPVVEKAVFPSAPSAKYAKDKPGAARMHTCLDQYHANKAANANGGLKWIQKGGGYYSVCLKKMKT
jgi:hypothetical protein